MRACHPNGGATGTIPGRERLDSGSVEWLAGLQATGPDHLLVCNPWAEDFRGLLAAAGGPAA